MLHVIIHEGMRYIFLNQQETEAVADLFTMIIYTSVHTFSRIPTLFFEMELIADLVISQMSSRLNQRWKATCLATLRTSWIPSWRAGMALWCWSQRSPKTPRPLTASTWACSCLMSHICSPGRAGLPETSKHKLWCRETFSRHSQSTREFVIRLRALVQTFTSNRKHLSSRMFPSFSCWIPTLSSFSMPPTLTPWTHRVFRWGTFMWVHRWMLPSPLNRTNVFHRWTISSGWHICRLPLPTQSHQVRRGRSISVRICRLLPPMKPALHQSFIFTPISLLIKDNLRVEFRTKAQRRIPIVD